MNNVPTKSRFLEKGCANQVKEVKVFTIGGNYIEKRYKAKYPDLVDLLGTATREMSKYYLHFYKIKQNPRVTFGKSKWEYYHGQPVNLREILIDEVVIEFDDTIWEGTKEQFINMVWRATHLTGINLFNDGICFEVWCHQGKSPHLHIHNLPISHLSKTDRKIWKECFIKHYVPKEYYPYADLDYCLKLGNNNRYLNVSFNFIEERFK